MTLDKSSMKLDKAPRGALPEGFLTIQELAAYYGVNKDVIRRANIKGYIPGAMTVVGRPVFNFAEAKHWVPHESVLRAKIAKEEGFVNPENSKLFAKGNVMAARDLTHSRRVAGQAVSKLTRREAKQYNLIMRERLTPEKWANIVDRAIEEAEAGGRDGHSARTWLGNYVMGRPVERIRAEVDLNVREEYTPAQRADALRSLLQSIVPVPASAQIVDVEPNKEVGDGGASKVAKPKPD